MATKMLQTRTSPKPTVIKAKIAEYMELKSPAKQLAILDWLAALEPALRKQMRYPKGGGLFDLESQTANTRFILALSLFAKQDRIYWATHDPAAFPWIPNTTFGVAMHPSYLAIEAATKKWKPKKVRARPNYAEVTRQLEAFLASELYSLYHRDVTEVLAVIALRQGKPKQVFARLGIEQGVIPSDMALYAGAAYTALGDVERACACYKGINVNMGYLAEARGDFALADRLYREGLAASWLAMRPYAKLRLSRLEQRLGKRELERLRAADTQVKIVVRTPADFHAQFQAIADALRRKLGISRKKQPMSDSEIAKIRIETKRHSESKSIELPKSAKTILRYDRNFVLFKNATPLLQPLLVKMKVVPSVNVEKLVRTAAKLDDSTGIRELSRLPKEIPLWNTDADLPACIELASPGDQMLLLYMGEPDANGEYPIARFDNQPELWISEASLIQVVLTETKELVHCGFEFAPLVKDARKRNAKHREGWSQHRDVTAILKKI